MKLNDYVECFNEIDHFARDSGDSYTSWIADLDKGPTGDERKVIVLGDLRPFGADKCNTSIAHALKAEPALPALDAAAKDYLDDLNVLVPLVSEAHTYYDQEDYKDDHFAKGKQMHKPLMTAFGRFMKASDVYGAGLEKENDALTAAQLVEIEKFRGRHSAYYRLALIIKGKQLTALLNVEGPDVGQATKAIDAYAALLDESTKATANEAEKPTLWSNYESTAGKFLKDCKDRMRRVRDKTPYSHGEQMLIGDDGSTAWMVEGTPERVLQSYNDLVQDSNRL